MTLSEEQQKHLVILMNSPDQPKFIIENGFGICNALDCEFRIKQNNLTRRQIAGQIQGHYDKTMRSP